MEIESGATFEDLELKYPDIATYDDLAIHVKIPVTISFNMLEIPSVGIRLPFSLSPFNTTMGADVIYERIARGLRWGQIESVPSGPKLILRVNSSSMSDRVVLHNTKTPIGLALGSPNGPATVDVIVEPNGSIVEPNGATSEETLLRCGDKLEKKVQDIIVRAKKYKTVDDAIRATELRLELLEAIQAANKVKTDLDEKTAWIKGTARCDMQDLVEDYLDN